MERMDKQGTVVTEPAMTVQCGLIYTIQAAWSGEKWQMDIGVGHRHMYLTILRNIRFFSPPEVGWSDGETQYSIEQLWAEWTDHETRSRLIYTWVVVDQELSLFYDTPPLLSITELNGPVPDDDALWLATNPSEWKQALQVPDDSIDATINALRNRPRCSLRDLFHFLSSNDLQRPEMTSLGPLQLRLLLYPLHALVCNFHQSLSLSTTMNQPLKLHKTMTQMSTMLQHAEIKTLLHRWRELSDRQPAAPTATARTLADANLTLYHLIHLNLLTSLKDIESHARAAPARPAAALRDTWLNDAEEALVHSGQALRLLRGMDATRRPIWWAAAAYRAAVVLWAHSGGAAQGPPVGIDCLPLEDEALQRFLRHRQGVPRLTGAGGEAVGLEEPGVVVRACVEGMEMGPMRCLVWEGIRCKLEAMARACGAGG
ncbi:putative transcription factor cmr1 protein [Neofusicoccum parvum]|nr:putative transcription factor cmr1 protein [Neofusicoccum parvum]